MSTRLAAETRKEIQIPTIRRDALIAPETIDVENRTVEIVWSTGARRVTWSWSEWDLIEEELDLEGADLSRLNNGAPFLKDHAAWSIDNQLGVHVDGSCIIDTAAKVGRAKVRFSKRADVEPYWQDVVDKILRQVSVGYQVGTYVVTREEGRLPLYRATVWTPLENSLVTIGADPGAQVRSAIATRPSLYSCVLVGASRSATQSTAPKESAMPKNKIPNQTQKRAMSDDVKTKVKAILTEYAVAEDKLDEATDKIAALWPEETVAGEGDMAEAARALGTEDATPKGIAKAAKVLRELFDAKDAQLEEQEEEERESEFEANEKKGLHRNLERVRAGYARDLYDSNPLMYRKEVEKVKPLTNQRPPVDNPSTRRNVSRHAAESDDATIAKEAEAEEKRILRENPGMDRRTAYRQAVSTVRERNGLGA